MAGDQLLDRGDDPLTEGDRVDPGVEELAPREGEPARVVRLAELLDRHVDPRAGVELGEPVDDLGLEAEHIGERSRGLARPARRAGDQRVDALGAQPPGEAPRLLVPVDVELRIRRTLLHLAADGQPVTDEEKLHGGDDTHGGGGDRPV